MGERGESEWGRVSGGEWEGERESGGEWEGEWVGKRGSESGGE